MRSIFGKILIWYFATLLGCLFAFAVISYMMAPSPGKRTDLFSRIAAMQIDEAASAYQSGGPPALRGVLKRFNRIFGATYYLADAAGHDLITGEDRSALAAEMHRRPLFPALAAKHPFTVAFRSDDRRYLLIATGLTPPDNGSGLPYYLCVLAAVGILCYIMAVHLATPARKLRQTVEQFGRGELSVRADVRRHDELGDLARAFNQMAGRTQTLLTAERRLLQDISHELRSPLARLEFAVELARTSDNRGASLDRIKRDVDRLGTLVGELFQVTRAEGDPLSRKRDDVALDELVRGLVEDCTLEAEVRHCRVSLTADEPVHIQGDPELLRRAVENVVRNAIRHAPDETSIEIGLARKNGIAIVSVRDYGTGVPEDALQDIFKPFFRVESDRNRASGGVGLGLSIAQRAIDLHHGSLYARNMHPGLMMMMELPVTS